MVALALLLILLFGYQGQKSHQIKLYRHGHQDDVKTKAQLKEDLKFDSLFFKDMFKDSFKEDLKAGGDKGDLKMDGLFMKDLFKTPLKFDLFSKDSVKVKDSKKDHVVVIEDKLALVNGKACYTAYPPPITVTTTRLASVTHPVTATLAPLSISTYYYTHTVMRPSILHLTSFVTVTPHELRTVTEELTELLAYDAVGTYVPCFDVSTDTVHVTLTETAVVDDIYTETVEAHPTVTSTVTHHDVREVMYTRTFTTEMLFTKSSTDIDFVTVTSTMPPLVVPVTAVEAVTTTLPCPKLPSITPSIFHLQKKWKAMEKVLEDNRKEMGDKIAMVMDKMVTEFKANYIASKITDDFWQNYNNFQNKMEMKSRETFYKLAKEKLIMKDLGMDKLEQDVAHEYPPETVPVVREEVEKLSSHCEDLKDQMFHELYEEEFKKHQAELELLYKSA